MNILLFGKNGQLGWELQRSLAPLGQVIALDSRSENWCGNLKNLEGIKQTIRTIVPDIIVNAAAYTAVDQAETDNHNAHLLNTLAPGLIAEQAKQCGAWFIHYSTDYVFDGHGKDPWTETDLANPLNIYGKTKLEGENLIRSSGCQHLIFRTSWVYAARGKNFAKTILKLAKERETLKVINDQIGAPTGAELIADVTALAICKSQNHPELSGLYHLVALGESSWYDYARFILDYATQAGSPLKLSANQVQAIPSAEFPSAAARPQNSRLNTQRLQRAFDLHLPEWQQGVTRMLTEILERA